MLLQLLLPAWHGGVALELLLLLRLLLRQLQRLAEGALLAAARMRLLRPGRLPWGGQRPLHGRLLLRVGLEAEPADGGGLSGGATALEPHAA